MPCDGIAELERDLLDLGEGVLEVALDVVAEGLQGRDVDDVDLVGERLLLGFADQAVDGDEEGGEGLAGAGGGGDEGVAAGDDLGPAEGLGVGGGAELALEPGADGGVEGVEKVFGHRFSVIGLGPRWTEIWYREAMLLDATGACPTRIPSRRGVLPRAGVVGAQNDRRTYVRLVYDAGCPMSTASRSVVAVSPPVRKRRMAALDGLRLFF